VPEIDEFLNHMKFKDILQLGWKERLDRKSMDWHFT